MTTVNTLIHRVASDAEARAFETSGVRMLGVSLLQNADLADGRELTVAEAESVVSSIRDADVWVECDPERTFELPDTLNRGHFIWSPYKANTRLLKRAADMGYRIIVGPVALESYFDLRTGPPVSPLHAYEYQGRGGESGAIDDTLTKPGIFKQIRESSVKMNLFVGLDIKPKNQAAARTALGPAGHFLTLGQPSVPPAGRHHQTLFSVFDTLAALGYPALPDSDLSRLQVAQTARCQQAMFRLAKERAFWTGKEPFDLERFGTLYPIDHDRLSLGKSPEKLTELWEHRYYLRTPPHVKTLAEFAAHFRTIQPWEND